MVQEEVATTTAEAKIPTVDAPIPVYIARCKAHGTTPVPTANHQLKTTKTSQDSTI